MDFLSYFALAIIIFVFLTLAYGIVAIHDTGAAIEGVNTDVARVQAKLATAEFNLSETTVRAPTDGMVLQLFLREGMMAVPLPLRPVMVFGHDEPAQLWASFLQNSAQRVEEGSDAEVILPAVPGRFFKAKVRRGRSCRSRGTASGLGHVGLP